MAFISSQFSCELLGALINSELRISVTLSVNILSHLRIGTKLLFFASKFVGFILIA